MKRRALVLASGIALLVSNFLTAAEPGTRSAKEALQTFNDLIGVWRGTGTPPGSREDQQKNFWVETMTWEWQFKGADAWMTVAFDKSKNFTKGELRYLPTGDQFALTLHNHAQEKHVFAGTLKNKVLTLARDTDKESHRLVFTFLHSNRFLYRAEMRPEGKNIFTKLYQVGATKAGVPFAAGDGRPECIVTGGLGTMAVAYMGKTYYVCCSGCRDEFRENPEKCIKEFAARKAKKEKGN